MAVVAKDGSLNTADCLYLESRLIELAKKSSSADVRNQTNPTPPFLSATDKTRVENFLAQIQTLFPVLNVNFFTPPPVLSPSVARMSLIATIPQSIPKVIIQNGTPPLESDVMLSPRFIFEATIGNAEAELVKNKFVVLKGSVINPNEKASMGKLNSALRSELKSTGKLVNDPQTGKWILTDNVAFTSPSAALAVICGYSIAGPKYWKIKSTGQTYGNWLQSQIQAVSNDGIAS